MELHESERRILDQIKRWERNLQTHTPTDFQLTYDKWIEKSFDRINPSIRARMFDKLDSGVFHLNAILQGSQMQAEARNRIISEAQLFDRSITELEDLQELPIQQLKYMANQQISKHRLVSFVQGGVTGTGGILLLAVDLPAIMTINLRAIQLIGMSYGYDVRYPFEMMMSLKILQMGTLPRRLQGECWDECKAELQDFSGNSYIYEGEEKILDETWLSQPVNQLAKSLVIAMFRKKLIQGIPMVGIAVGAGVNYQLTKRVTEFAHHFYQYRHLTEKLKKGNIQ